MILNILCFGELYVPDVLLICIPSTVMAYEAISMTCWYASQEEEVQLLP